MLFIGKTAILQHYQIPTPLQPELLLRITKCANN